MTSNLHMDHAALLIESLYTAGVRDAVVSPGSRSTPLVLALANEPRIATRVCIDERSAAFFALGISSYTHRPTLLVCTSGTAAAHYLPAIIEASLTGIPLIMLTADRPWDAYDCAAPQTIDQVKLYANYVRHYAELGLPEVTTLAAVQRIAAHAVSVSLGDHPGPVHLNARFRKPLEPVAHVGEPPYARSLGLARARTTHVFAAPKAPHEIVLSLAHLLAEYPDGVIACGPSVGSDRLAPHVVALARATGYPVLAESTSDVRMGCDPAVSLSAIEPALRSERWRTEPPSVVIEVGLPMVSTAYAQWLSGHAHKLAARIVVTPWGHPDPSGSATHLLVGAVAETLAALTAARTEKSRTTSEPTWRSRWLAAQSRANAHLVEASQPTLLTELSALDVLLKSLGPTSALLVGNSSVVRDIDLVAPASAPVRVLHQRGASGIDGLIARAAGSRAAQRDGVLALVLGDVAFWHDVGSLQTLSAVDQPLVVLVLNNHGGRIFDRLPIAKDSSLREDFSKYFVTAPVHSIARVAEAFGVRVDTVSTHTALVEALSRAQAHQGPTVLEVDCTPGSAERFASLVASTANAMDARPTGAPL
ncbi:MAG: 2-succinyl-5-enolpyruvyl-6-hydroxy-3-cyclohexene-1-carboxylic-acid synthase [Deltaproteobacteria bacterium]|nr:2-succinyl-5-enolpyruvyl-6-hydroxy-3-cyclohexene-1-carboxylic-acid synthase [Deltaproteobacteria bacterium]